MGSMYTSDQSGTLGFGPWSQENGNIRDDAKRSFMEQGVEDQIYSKNVVSYNITFKGEHNHMTPPDKTSYVQLDVVNSDISSDAEWVPTETWNDWSVNILTAGFSTTDGGEFPIVEGEG